VAWPRMGAAVGTADQEEGEEEVSATGPSGFSEGEKRQQRAAPSVQWQVVARHKCRVPRAGNAWLFDDAFGGDVEDAKKQAAAVGGAHFTKYDSWLQVVGNDSCVDTPQDPSAVLFSQASAAWTPLGASLYNVDRGGVLRSHSQDETPTSVVSNMPAMAVSFRATDNEAQRSLGLAVGTSGHARLHFTLVCDADRSIYAGNALYGWDVRDCGSSCDGDVLTIEHSGSEVIFRKNSEVLHSKPFSLTPGEQFYAYACITQANGEMPELTYVPTPVKPSLSFRLYRFTPTRLRSDAATAVQVSELSFRQRGPPGTTINLRHAVASNPGGHNPASQGPEMAIDGKRDTKWLDLNRGPLVVELPPSKYRDPSVDEFCFTTANDSDDRDPVQWRLEGSMTGADWTLLHVQSHLYETPRERRAQTAWFPFNTFDLEQERLKPGEATPVAAQCLISRATFETHLRGVTCMNWQEFCAFATLATDARGAALARSAAFLLNLLIWSLLTMLGVHRSAAVGLAATLGYGFALRALLGLDRHPQSAGASPSTLAPARPWARRWKGVKQD